MRPGARLARRGGLVGLAALSVLLASRPAHALDGPFTWEEVLCQADAAAEIEMVLATKTSPDRMEVRRVIWNRTKHRIRPDYGQPDIPSVTKTRFRLLASLARYRREQPGERPPPEFVVRYRRALARGRYRTIVFLKDFGDGSWLGGGVVYSGVEWLDHPKHAEWWAKVEPYLRQVIVAASHHEKPPFCADVSPAATRLRM